jgi:hypothetical protein
VHAEIDGPCNAAIAGVSLRDTDSNDPDTAIKVDKDSQIGVAMMASAGFASHTVSLEFAGIQWEVNSQTHDGQTDWVHVINVDDYATYGVGLYKVVGEATLTDGSTCSGAALIDVQGSPFGTVAGILAAVSVVGGAAAIVMSSLASYGEGVQARRRVRRWLDDQVKRIEAGEMAVDMGAFKGAVGKLPIFPVWLIAALPALLLTGSMVSAGGIGGAAVAGIRLPRSSFRPKISLIGGLGGIFFAEGIVVLLQQYAVQPLTQSSALAGVVVGLGLAVTVTTLVRLWSNAETNRAIAAAEARINETIEKELATAGMAPLQGAPPPDQPAQSPEIDQRPPMDPRTQPPSAPPPEDQPLM